MDGRVPRDLGGRGGARADVVDGADVAAIEADAGMVLEEVRVGGVLGEEGEEGGRWRNVGREGEQVDEDGGVGGGWGRRWEGCAVEVASEVVVHGCEAELGA